MVEEVAGVNKMYAIVQSPQAIKRERDFWTQVGFERDAGIEALLYHSGVSDKFFKDLVPKLRRESRATLNSALLLYDRLEFDTRLTEQMKAELLIRLVDLVKGRGASALIYDNPLDELVENYLSVSQQSANGDGIDHKIHPEVTRKVRDGRTFMEEIPYGNKSTVIVYGKQKIHNPEKLCIYLYSRSKDRRLHRPLKTEVEKVEALLGAVSNPRPDWRYATELILDLKPREVTIFHRNHQLYMTLLTYMGAIIKQNLPVQARLIYARQSPYGYHKWLPIPIGFKIKKYEPMITSKGVKATNGKDGLAKDDGYGMQVERPAKGFVNRSFVRPFNTGLKPQHHSKSGQLSLINKRPESLAGMVELSRINTRRLP